MKDKGLSFLQNLGLIFIVLKLTNNIDWSWFLVLIPSILWFLCDFGIISYAYYKHQKELSKK